jgi:YVTN family beta-propeller protein
LATRTAGHKISLGHEFPDHLVASPDSSTVYVMSGAGVTPIDVGTNTASQAIPAGSGPWTMAITPNGRRGYVADNGTGSQPASTVTVLNLRTRTTSATIQVGLRPLAVVLTP